MYLHDHHHENLLDGCSLLPLEERLCGFKCLLVMQIYEFVVFVLYCVGGVSSPFKKAHEMSVKKDTEVENCKL